MAAVNSERGWQVGKTLRECNSYMFDNQVACDIKFLIQSPDGSVVTVPAHKYVLVSRSPVFEAMLSGDFTESAGDVVISDIEPPVFKDMLQYVYTEETDITADNVLYLMTAARKYILDGLEGKCVEFMEKNIDTENVCTVFDHAVSQESADIASRCLKLMKTATLEVLSSDSFLELSQPSLIDFLKCDDLSLEEETHILKACKKWAEHRLGEKGDHTEENIRTILGDALFQIRFCSTTIKEIISNNLEDLLSGENFKLLATTTMENYSDSEKPGTARKKLQDAGYNINPRSYTPSKILRAVRLGKNISNVWRSNGGIPDAISFSVSKPIFMCGVSVYCSSQQQTDTCDVEVYDGVSNTWTPKTPATVVSDGMKIKQDVMLEKPIRLEAGVDHAVKVTLMRGNYYYGENGLATTEVEGVTFSFMVHVDATNCTNITRGQIPEILFKHGPKI